MLKLLLVAVAGLTLLGCEYFAPRPSFTAVSPGMTREQVAELVGAPHHRHTRDELEAWEYCANGWLTDDYMVVWFNGPSVLDTVIELDPDLGLCGSDSTQFSWDKAPGAEAAEES